MTDLTNKSRLLEENALVADPDYEGIPPETWAKYVAPTETVEERMVLMLMFNGGYGDDPRLPIFAEFTEPLIVMRYSIEETARHLKAMRSRGLLNFIDEELQESIDGKRQGLWFTLNLESSQFGK